MELPETKVLTTEANKIFNTHSAEQLKFKNIDQKSKRKMQGTWNSHIASTSIKCSNCGENLVGSFQMTMNERNEMKEKNEITWCDKNALVLRQAVVTHVYTFIKIRHSAY